MADRFTPKDLDAGSGLVSKDHKVLLTNGESLRVYRGGSLKGNRGRMRNLEMRDAKRRILNRVVKQDRAVRSSMNKLIDDFEMMMFKEEKRGARDRQGRLRRGRKAIIQAKTNKLVRAKVVEMRGRVRDDIEASVKTYLIGVRRSLTDRNQLPMSKINQMARDKAKQVMNSKSYGKTANQRVARYAKRMSDELMVQAELSFVERRQRMSVLKKRLVDPKGSHRQCVAKGISRINRTEQNRAMHSATLDVMNDLGVELAYWRLSSSHKNYGGGEVCEVLATNTGGGVEDALRRASANVDRTGLYLADAFPVVPHPNCMCSIEPVFI